MKRNDIQRTGVLTDLKVLISGGAIAAPVAGCLMAEWGADVIQIENHQVPDMFRHWKYAWPADRRNVRNIVLDMFSEDGRKVLERLISEVDIVIESSKGGSWAKNGFSDERMWELNPKLVIAHISGFGQYGVDKFVRKVSYDPIGQAYSGYALVNGDKGDIPYCAVPMVSDYLNTLTATSACLASYINALKTGKGESLDLAQYEVTMRFEADYANTCFNTGLKADDVRKPVSGKASSIFKTKEGTFVYFQPAPNYWWRALNEIGVYEDDPRVKEKKFIVWPADSYEFQEIFHVAMAKYAAEHTVAEIDEMATRTGALFAEFLEFTDMLEHPHFKARNSIIEYYDETLQSNVKTVGPVPKFTNNPQTIWRGGPTRGADSNDILEELGFNADEIAALRSTGSVQ